MQTLSSYFSFIKNYQHNCKLSELYPNKQVPVLWHPNGIACYCIIASCTSLSNGHCLSWQTVRKKWGKFSELLAFFFFFSLFKFFPSLSHLKTFSLHKNSPHAWYVAKHWPGSTFHVDKQKIDICSGKAYFLCASHQSWLQGWHLCCGTVYGMGAMQTGSSLIHSLLVPMSNLLCTDLSGCIQGK